MKQQGTDVCQSCLGRPFLWWCRGEGFRSSGRSAVGLWKQAAGAVDP
jgi:hypothetical protein